MSNDSLPPDDEPLEEELLMFTSYEELASRPRFRPEIDPKVDKPERITGVYHFATEERCALGLHMHKKGLSFLTDTGIESNMGHRCGANCFGADWTVLANQAELAQKMSAFKRQIRATKAAIPRISFASLNSRTARAAGSGSSSR